MLPQVELLSTLMALVIALGFANWRVTLGFLSLITTIHAVLVVFPDSPQSLIARNQPQAAKQLLKYIAFQNGVILKNLKVTQDKVVKRLGFEELFFSDSTLTLYVIVMMTCWLMASFLSYSLQFIALNVPGNAFWSFLIVMQIPSLMTILITFLLMDSIGRRYTMTFSFLLTSISMGTIILCNITWPALNFYIVFTIFCIAKVGAGLSFNSVYLMTAELFPTPLRQQALSVCSCAARVGAIFGPFLGFLNNIFPDLTLIMMTGLGCVVMGLSLILPETKGKALPATIEETVTTKSRVMVNEYPTPWTVVKGKIKSVFRRKGAEYEKLHTSF